MRMGEIGSVPDEPEALSRIPLSSRHFENDHLPECQLNLAQAVTYLATAPKSNASSLAITQARDDIRAGRTLAVPSHLRNTHYKSAEKLGHGADYQYSHDHPGGWVDQRYLSEERRYYEPVDRGYEAVIRQRMEELRRKRGVDEGKPPEQVSRESAYFRELKTATRSRKTRNHTHPGRSFTHPIPPRLFSSGPSPPPSGDPSGPIFGGGPLENLLWGDFVSSRGSIFSVRGVVPPALRPLDAEFTVGTELSILGDGEAE